MQDFDIPQSVLDDPEAALKASEERAEAGDDEEQLIPEGERLCFLYNMYGRPKKPRGAKGLYDFQWTLRMTWLDQETGLFIKRLNNGADNPAFNYMVFHKRVGKIDTTPNFVLMMNKLQVKPRKDSAGRNILWHHNEKNNQPEFRSYHDGGPMGMPAKLTIEHIQVPVRKLVDDPVKNQYGSYDDDQFYILLDDEGKTITKTVAVIKCDSRGFPILGKLSKEEKELRGTYQEAEQDQAMNDALAADAPPDDQMTPDDVQF